jgi:hypothetical protein
MNLTKLTVSGACNGAMSLGDNAVTQGTSNSTTVTSNNASGVITSFGAYTTAGLTAATSFTVTCGACKSTSVVICNIVSYGGTIITNGSPEVQVSGISNGSFVLTVYNANTVNALNGVIKFGYAVL